MSELKPCPWCGGPASLRNLNWIGCDNPECRAEGPDNDLDGSKWDALPRREDKCACGNTGYHSAAFCAGTGGAGPIGGAPQVGFRIDAPIDTTGSGGTGVSAPIPTPAPVDLNKATCETCPYFCVRPFGSAEQQTECRLNPPEGNGFTIVAYDEWCGQHPARKAAMEVKRD